MKINPDEYRFRCPKGHVTIRRLTRNIKACNGPKKYKGKADQKSYRCKTCKITYPGEPIDLLEGKRNETNN